MNKHFNFMFISTADWDNPFWTNKQHMAKILSEQGHKVVYFDSLGLRGPVNTSKKDRKRILRRLWKFFRGPIKINENLHVFSPLIIPKHDNPIISKINHALMSFYMKLMKLLYLSDKNLIYWTYNPLSGDFLNKGTIIYHCVDDLTAAPGLPIEKIKLKEAELVQKAKVTFVTSGALKAKLSVIRPDNIYYFPNVADVVHFSKALEPLQKPADLVPFKGPVLGFIGAISSYKVDFNLLTYISKKLPDTNIVLIGEVGEGQPGTSVDMLLDLPNVHLLGPKSYADLPAYLKYMDVALLPCTLNEYTKSMFPMKFFEYLSAEKKVVSTKLESIQEFSETCYIANSYDDFVNGVQKALNSDLKEFCNLRALKDAVAENTWSNRTNKMLNIVDKVLF